MIIITYKILSIYVGFINQQGTDVPRGTFLSLYLFIALQKLNTKTVPWINHRFPGMPWRSSVGQNGLAWIGFPSDKVSCFFVDLHDLHVNLVALGFVPEN